MASKLDPQKLKADWSRFERRPTWSVVSSRELAQVLDVHLQTINNWHIRNILPEPERHPRLNYNKNYYRISAVRAWLENRKESDIHTEWAKKWLADFQPIHTLEEVEFVVVNAYKFLNVEKPMIPAMFL